MAVVVAGGTRGIGYELAEGLSEPDASGKPRLVILGYGSDEESAVAAKKQLTSKGRQVIIVRSDLSTAAGANQLVDALPPHEPIDCLVHSAVQVIPGNLANLQDRIDSESWERALSVNATSLLHLVRAARPRLTRGSTILYVTSRGSRTVQPGYGAVGPAKALGEALVRYLAVELAGDGIRVNALAPGFQNTVALRKVVGDRIDKLIAASLKNNPSGRLVEPRDYVAVAQFLASTNASMVTGQVHYVHGGADLL